MKLEHYDFVDLTHKLHPQVPTWQGGCGFKSDIKLDYTKSKLSFRVQKLSMHAGIGTHMDAPSHCIPTGQSVADLPLVNLFAPGVVIKAPPDIHPSFSFKPEHIHDFEKKHGEIPKGACVLFHSGWDIYWIDPSNYRNHLHFPSVHKETAALLLEREIKGLGIDTLSPDRPKEGYPVHEAVLGAGKFIIENVAHLGSMPESGFTVIALPINIELGTEAPIRLVAMVPKLQQD